MKTKLLTLLSIFLCFDLVAQGNISVTMFKAPCNADGIVVAHGLNPQIQSTIRWGNFSTLEIHKVTNTTDTFFFYKGGIIYANTFDNNNKFNGSGFFRSDLPFKVDFNVIPKKCPELSIVTATVIGGVAPYTYIWKDEDEKVVGSTNPIGLQSGAYTAEITDANGCVWSQLDDSFAIYVSNDPGFTYTVLTTEANCTNGTATINNISGGLAPFTYKWFNQSNANAIQSLIAGNYIVTVTDAQGCNNRQNFYISQSKIINANTVPTNTTCSNNDGRLIAFGSGGKPPYSYAWNNGQLTQEINNMSEGFYYVNVIDADGCSGIGYGKIENFSPVQVTILDQTVSSCTTPSGSATLGIQGGLAPYDIVWNTFPKQTGVQLQNVPAGDYGFIVTDANFCKREGTVRILPEYQITPSFNINHATCLAANGSISTNVIGGSAPYKYQWSNLANTSTVNQLLAGSYNVTITDANGCQVTKYLSVNSESPIQISHATTLSSCIFSNDGSIITNVTGGTPPYKFNWSNGVTTANNNNLTQGQYYLFVTDAIGCIAYSHVYVNYNAGTDFCYCTIQGKVFHDVNNNCIKDPGESGISNIQMHLSQFGYTYTDANGDYSFRVPSGSYTLSESIQYQYPLSACQNNNLIINTTASSGCTLNYDFANESNPLRDIHISTWPIICPIPGFEYSQNMIISNDGTIPENNVIANYGSDYQLGDAQFSPSGHFIPDVKAGAYKVTNLGTIQEGNAKFFQITYQVPANIPLNTELWFDAECAYEAPISNWLNDYSPWNNKNLFKDIVVGSYDPNFMEVLPQGKGSEGFISKNDTILEYMVHFQNEGTYYARKVEVEVKLDPNLNWRSLKPVYNSHPVQVSINEKGKILFTFDNINLYPKSFSEALSNGFFTFTVKTNRNLAELTKIRNSADIYFDFNTPISTNTTLNTIEKLLSSNDPTLSPISFEINPNPNSGAFTLAMQSRQNTMATIQIIDLMGKINYSTAVQLVNGKQTIPVHSSRLTNGIYFVRIFLSDGSTMVKRVEIVND